MQNRLVTDGTLTIRNPFKCKGRHASSFGFHHSPLPLHPQLLHFPLQAREIPLEHAPGHAHGPEFVTVVAPDHASEIELLRRAKGDDEAQVWHAEDLDGFVADGDRRCIPPTARRPQPHFPAGEGFAEGGLGGDRSLGRIVSAKG